MAYSQCARSFASDIAVAIELGGRKAFIRAMNLTLRKFGEFKPISDHKAIRKEQAHRANWTRQNSQIQTFEYPNENMRTKYHEWGEIAEEAERSKPTAQMFNMMTYGMRRRKISPFTERGRRLIQDSRKDGRSHLRVGVQGWWRDERTGEILDVRHVTMQGTANSNAMGRGWLLAQRGRGRRNQKNRQNNRNRQNRPRQQVRFNRFRNPFRARGGQRRRGRRGRGRGAGAGRARGPERTPRKVRILTTQS